MTNVQYKNYQWILFTDKDIFKRCDWWKHQDVKYKLTKTNLVDALRNTTKKAILDVKKWSKDDVPLKTAGQESLIWDSINPLTPKI